jgi:hypothetical protein
MDMSRSQRRVGQLFYAFETYFRRRFPAKIPTVLYPAFSSNVPKVRKDWQYVPSSDKMRPRLPRLDIWYRYRCAIWLFWRGDFSQLARRGQRLDGIISTTSRVGSLMQCHRGKEAVAGCEEFVDEGAPWMDSEGVRLRLYGYHSQFWSLKV